MAHQALGSPSSLFDYPIIHHTSSKSLHLSAIPTFLLPLPTSKSLHVRAYQSQLSLNEDTQPHTKTQPQTPSKPNYVWVNPNSPRASNLRKHSYDSRYTSLVTIANAVDCSSPEQIPHLLLSSLGNDVVEQDAVVVLNNMSNPQTALLALTHFQTTLKLSNPTILYNVTLKVLRKKKDLDSAEKLFDEMLQRKIPPDNVTFSTIISCCRVCNMPEKAVEWFEKMPAFGCSPDDVTYSAMIDAYGKAGNVDMALGLYDRARTERWRIDVVTFSTLIKIYGRTGNFDGCLNVYEEMKALGVKANLVIYNTLLDAMGRAKRPWQAKSVYREMRSNGIEPNWGTYVALLRAFCKARYGEDAMRVYREMKEKGLELNVVLYNTVLAMCADVGYVDEAVEVFEEMKGSCGPDSWSFSAMITVYSCCGKVEEAEGMLNEMVEAGFEPNIYVLTSLVQCYGKAGRTDDVVRMFDRVVENGIVPDDRFCGCLLNVMTQTPREELSKLVECVAKANPKIGDVVKVLLEGEKNEGEFRGVASGLFDVISTDVKKAYCNCLIDLCVNLDLLDRACELLDLGLSSQIYTDIQSKTPTQWSLHLKSLSLGAALTSLHVWMNDLTKAVEAGEELPPVLGINTGHGKHKYSEKGLAGVFEAHLKELNAPFHEAPDRAGWFLTTRDAAQGWLESRKSQS